MTPTDFIELSEDLSPFYFVTCVKPIRAACEAHDLTLTLQNIEAALFSPRNHPILECTLREWCHYVRARAALAAK